MTGRKSRSGWKRKRCKNFGILGLGNWEIVFISKALRILEFYDWEIGKSLYDRKFFINIRIAKRFEQVRTYLLKYQFPNFSIFQLAFPK